MQRTFATPPTFRNPSGANSLLLMCSHRNTRCAPVWEDGKSKARGNCDLSRSSLTVASQHIHSSPWKRHHGLVIECRRVPVAGLPSGCGMKPQGAVYISE